MQILPLLNEVLVDLGDLRVMGVSGARRVVDEPGTVWGLVVGGRPAITMGEDAFRLRPGMFFVSPERTVVDGGQALLIQLRGYKGQRAVGGPPEREGRLRYIDGCTDSLLVCPPRLGEPCLNHLHIPAGTLQSAHTHPSVRIGVIVRGRGEAHVDGETIPLAPGSVWLIPAGVRHNFATPHGEALDVLAWHPDSDFGPTDQNHPMLNRTVLDALAAPASPAPSEEAPPISKPPEDEPVKPRKSKKK